MKRQKRMISRSIRTLIVLACCFGLGVQLNAPLLAASANQPPTSADLKAIYAMYRAKETAYKTAASAYDQEISRFRSVNSMPLKTTDDARKILDAMQSISSAGLKKVYDKTVIVAMSNSAYKAGLEAESDRSSPSALMSKIKANPRFLTNIAGYSSARDAVKRKLAEDSALLKQLSTKLNEFSQRRGALSPSLSESPLRTLVAKENDRPSAIRVSYSPSSARAYSTSSATKTNPSLSPQGGAIEAALIAAAVLLIGAYAAVKVKDISEPADPDNEEDTRSRYAICVDESYAKRDTCLRRSDFFGDMGCMAIFAIDIAACTILPN